MKRRTFFNLGGARLAGSLVPWHRVYSAEAGPEESLRLFRELSGRNETFYSFDQSGHHSPWNYLPSGV